MFNLEGIDQDALALLTPIELALFWAARGVPVVPTDPDTKAPFGKAWQHRATTDPDTIRSWPDWARGARVGIKTGLSCGVGCQDGPDVLDFDVSEGKPGIKQMGTLAKAGLIDWATAMVVQTPSGGTHWWFAGTTGHNKQNVDEVWGVDFRAHHGMVLAPGNPDYTIIEMPTEPLAQIKWDEIAACPGLLAKPRVPTTGLPAQPATRTAPPPTDTPLPPPVSLVGFRGPNRLVAPKRAFDDPIGEESPLDWYTRNHDIEQVLVSAGWQFVHESEGKRHFVRPGKKTSDGVSGNIAPMADGRLVFYNFSSSTELPTDRALSTAQLYAWFYHGGDMRAAAGAVRRTLMPQRGVYLDTRTPLPSPPTNQTALVGMQMGAAATHTTERLPGAELVVSGIETPDPIRAFWRRRPELREIWWQSQIAGVSPWAVLGGCLAQVAARVGPHVALPPPGGVGTPGSLNVLIAISGNSGTGKGLALGVARGFFGGPNPPQRKPGTGQGIAAIFTEQTRDGPVQTNDTAVLNVSEITGLGAHADMQGSNLVATLLEVYMGEELGEHYANKEKRRPVSEGKYRLALTAGVQPGNSHILLDHAESGLPQRFIWMPAFWKDSVLPETTLAPPAPGHELRRWRSWSHILPGSMDDSIEATGWSPSDAAYPPKKEVEGAVPIKDAVMVTLAPAVKREVDRDRQRRLNILRKRQEAGEDDPGDPDSHLLLSRLKVAAHLAIWLDCSTEISEDVWDLTMPVMWVSNDTRVRSANRLRDKAADKAAGRVFAKISETRAMEEETDRKRNATYIGACDRVMHLVTTTGGWIATRALTMKMASKERARYKDAGIELVDVLNDLVLAGKIQTREVEKSGNVTHEWAVR